MKPGFTLQSAMVNDYLLAEALPAKPSISTLAWGPYSSEIVDYVILQTPSINITTGYSNTYSLITELYSNLAILPSPTNLLLYRTFETIAHHKQIKEIDFNYSPVDPRVLARNPPPQNYKQLAKLEEVMDNTYDTDNIMSVDSYHEFPEHEEEKFPELDNSIITTSSHEESVMFIPRRESGVNYTLNSLKMKGLFKVNMPNIVRGALQIVKGAILSKMSTKINEVADKFTEKYQDNTLALVNAAVSKALDKVENGKVVKKNKQKSSNKKTGKPTKQQANDKPQKDEHKQEEKKNERVKQDSAVRKVTRTVEGDQTVFSVGDTTAKVDTKLLKGKMVKRIKHFLAHGGDEGQFAKAHPDVQLLKKPVQE
jgi:hypothetical protein